MERCLPPVFDHQLRHQDRDLTIREVMLNLQNVLDQRHVPFTTLQFRGGVRIQVHGHVRMSPEKR